ncbi:MAG: 2-oxo acid dehydrogenase subunit E2 [Acidobacteria bacterium]|nr:2-oxo acid dehydrogenase subunit E2 [Acidobacteriota bacterium]
MKPKYSHENRVVGDAPLRGETAYIYELKRRAKEHHCMGYGTFTIDLTETEPLRRAYSRRIRPITYVPLYIKATALAVQKNPEANSILFRKLFGYRIVRFRRVDVNLPVTRKLGDRWITYVATIRDAAEKPLYVIQSELAEALRCAPEEFPALARFLKFDAMPLWSARLVHWWMKWSPEFYVRNVGSCGITLADGDWFDHGFPIAPTSVCFGLGGMKKEPIVRGDSVAVARVQKCSIMVDNYVVPGLVGAKLMRDFKALMESGALLAEELRNEETSAAEAQICAEKEEPLVLV